MISLSYKTRQPFESGHPPLFEYYQEAQLVEEKRCQKAGKGLSAKKVCV